MGGTGVTGPTGPTGVTGCTGPYPTFRINTVTTGGAGTNASVTIDSTSTSSMYLLYFVIPQGIQGIQGINADSGHLQSEIDGLIAGAAIDSTAIVGLGVAVGVAQATALLLLSAYGIESIYMLHLLRKLLKTPCLICSVTHAYLTPFH